MPFLDAINHETLLIGLVMPISLGIILSLVGLAQLRKVGNGKSNPGSIICPLNPVDLHEDMREIVKKLDNITNKLERLMGRLEDGGRRGQES